MRGGEPMWIWNVWSYAVLGHVRDRFITEWDVGAPTLGERYLVSWGKSVF